jgi:hypothetical protein
MNKRLEKLLIDKYPTFFIDMYGDPRRTCMAWGCDHGDGWFTILEKACKKIAKLDEGTFKFDQIKEKWGAIRVYYTGASAEMSKIIDELENESLKTCEHCGTKRNVTTEGDFWILTLCRKCRSRVGQSEDS